MRVVGVGFWCTSLAAHGACVLQAALRTAEEVLEKHPHMRNVHSKLSLAKVLEELTKRNMKAEAVPKDGAE